MREILPDRKFDFFYDILLFTGAVCVITPGVYSLVRFFIPASWAAFTLPAVTLLLLAGWLMQALYSAITHNERVGSGSYSYETAERPFRTSRAIVPLIVAVVIAAASRYIFDRALYAAGEARLIDYDEFSALPYFGAIIVFVVMMLGIIMWFYPVERLATIKTFLPCMAIMLIEYVFSLYGDAGMSNLSAACLAAFVSISVILMNQTYILKTFHGSVVSVITPRARLFNILLVALFIVGALAMMGLLYILLFGITTIIRILLFYMIYSAKLDEEYGEGMRYYDEADLEVNFSKVVYGQRNSAGSEVMFGIFAVVAVVLLFFLVFGRTTFVRSIIEWFKRWIAELIEFLSNSRYFMKRSSPKEELLVSYKDEEIKRQYAAIRSYEENIPEAKNYKDFLNKLAKCRTYGEKLGFAYRTLITLYRKMNVPIKRSDTPREIAVKVHNAVESGRSIDEITRVFELVSYAETDPSDHEAGTVLETLCSIIKKYTY